MDRLVALLRTHSFRTGDFVLASGARSAYYVDVRKTSLDPEGAQHIGDAIVDAIIQAGWKPDGVGGLTLGADPLTTATSLAAWRRGLRWSGFLVRKEAKAHGAGRRIECGGSLPASASVVVLEDTATTGGSALLAIEAARAEGFNVLGAVCVVDRLEGAREALRAVGVELRALVNVSDLLVT